MSQTETNVMAAALRPSADQVILQTISENLETYVTTMKPATPVDSAKGGEMQRLLHRTIRQCTKLTGSSFALCWTHFLKVVHENRQGCFAERYVYRYMDSVPLSQVELRSFQRMLHLALATCNPATRMLAVRQIDLGLVVVDLPAGGDLIKAYYTDY